MVVPHGQDFSSPNISPAISNDEVGKPVDKPIVGPEAKPIVEPAVEQPQVNTVTTAAPTAMPVEDTPNMASPGIITSTTSAGAAAQSRPRFIFNARRFDSNAANTPQQSSVPFFKGTPEYFNQAIENTELNGGRKNSVKRIALIIGGCLALALLAVLGIIALNPASRNPLVASGGLKDKFYSFANKYLYCEDKKDKITGEYDSKKSYCASEKWKDDGYVSDLQKKYDEFFAEYGKEKGGLEAYQDVMYEFDSYMKFLLVWRKNPEITETQFSTYYLKNGHDATINYFNNKISVNYAGDSGKIIGYRDYAKAYIAGLADKYAVYVANNCFGGLGNNISTCTSRIKGESLTKLQTAMGNIDEAIAGMTDIREGAFIYMNSQIFNLAKIMEGKQ